MPLPTIITWAGSCPDPEPWMIETLSSRGASARMMRLYSGTYRSVSGLARAMAVSISGPNWRGSLTNFFTALASKDCDSGCGVALAPLVGERLEHDGHRDRAGVQGADAALPGVAGPAAHGLPGPGRPG